MCQPLTPYNLIVRSGDNGMAYDECFLILGGAGLVGKQIARRIADELHPRKIIIASLFRHEVTDALAELQQIFGNQSPEWAGVWGNIFVRSEYSQEPRPSCQRATSAVSSHQDLLAVWTMPTTPR
jgi:hypothetical protein